MALKRKLVEHEVRIRDMAKRHGVEITKVELKKSAKYGPYIDIRIDLQKHWELPPILTFMRELRDYFKTNREHGAVNLAIGAERKYLLHFPFNYKKRNVAKLPKIKGVTLHHGPPKEHYGKYMLALPLDNDNYHIFDDVGVMIEEKNNEDSSEEKRTLTDFDVLGINVRDGVINFRIGEVLTSNHARIEHKAQVWADFFKHLTTMGYNVSVYPLIVAATIPGDVERVKNMVDKSMKKNGFKQYGRRIVSTTKYQLWQIIVKGARHLPEELHEPFIRQANRAMTLGDGKGIERIYGYAELARTLPKVKKAINLAAKKGKISLLREELEKYDDYIEKYGAEQAAVLFFRNVSEHLPKNGKNHIKKKLGI